MYSARGIESARSCLPHLLGPTPQYPMPLTDVPRRLLWVELGSPKRDVQSPNRSTCDCDLLRKDLCRWDQAKKWGRTALGRAPSQWLTSLWDEGHLDRDARREASPARAETEGWAMHLQAKEAGGRQRLGEARRAPPWSLGRRHSPADVSMTGFGPPKLWA